MSWWFKASVSAELLPKLSAAFIAAFLIWTVGSGSASAEEIDPANMMSVPIPMSDGVKLAADIYLPVVNNATFPVPTLLIVTPYGRSFAAPLGKRWTGQGYAVVSVESRGTFDSDGEYKPYVNEGRDAHEVIEWIAVQDWSNGEIGMFGKSYPAFVEIAAAAHASPHLKAIIPVSAQEDNFSSIWYVDGLLNQALAFRGALLLGGRINSIDVDEINWMQMLMHLPVSEALEKYGINSQFVTDVIRHSTYDDFWRSISVRGRQKDMDVPALHMTGWFDGNIHETFINFKAMRERSKSEHARKWQRLIVGPWGHHSYQLWNILPSYPAFDGRYGSADFGTDAVIDALAVHERWYEYHLKGVDNGLADEPPIQIFVMGENVWRGEQEWPLKRTEFQRLYLRANSPANGRWGGGRLKFQPPEDEAPDTFRYDPRNPVFTYGGNQCCTGPLTPDGPLDQRANQSRPDVLVYDTEPLESDLEITGQIILNLHFSTSVEDTDFFATISDVYPDGAAIPVAEGGLRARYRNSNDETELLKPGETYAVNIALWETSNLFRAGHRIRLHITSSNFPRYNRNLNSAKMPSEAREEDIRIAIQTIFHDADNPSSIVIPVIPRP